MMINMVLQSKTYVVVVSCLLLVGSTAAQRPEKSVSNKWFDGQKWPFEEGKRIPVEGGDDKLPEERIATPKKTTIPVNILQEVAELYNSSQFLDEYLNFNTGEGGKPLTGKVEGVDNPLTIISRTVFDHVSGQSGAKPRPNGFSKIGLIPNKIAQHALCMPTLQVVELAREDDPFVLHYPTCTRVKRCGGCCRSALLQCQPSQTRKLQLQVIKTRYSTDRSKPFNFEALKNITVEEHTKCKCQCKVKATDCNSLQIYKANECRCQCNNQDELKKCRGSDKFWDSNRCACRCKNYQDQCSTGRRFSEKICRCIPEAAFKLEQSGESDWLFGRTADSFGGVSRRRLGVVSDQ